MKFLFTEEWFPQYWNIKADIIQRYFELCEAQFREPWFKPHEPITPAYFRMAIDSLEQAGVL